MIKDELLNEIRQVKSHCTSDKFDFEEGYGELCYMVWTALDIADELREALLLAHSQDKKLVYGDEVPKHYKDTINEQLERIKRQLGMKDE